MGSNSRLLVSTTTALTIFVALCCRANDGVITSEHAVANLIDNIPCEIRKWESTNTTKDFQRAIDACAAGWKRGAKEGEDHVTAFIPMPFATLHVFVNVTVGSIVLPSDFTLFVHKGATMYGSLLRSDYPLIQPLPSYGTARDNAKNLSFVHRPLIYIPNRKNVRITGRGVIDGRGGEGGWWAQEKNGTLVFQRPRLVQFVNSTNMYLDGGLTLSNSAFWTVHLVYSRKARFFNVRIISPRDSPNTDGIDVDSTSDVVISHCDIDVGDDAVAIKSGIDEFGRAVNIPSTNVLIQDNRIFGKAIAIGSEMSGGVYNVTARRNIMGMKSGAVTGFLIKSRVPRGGMVSNITFADCHLLNVSRVYSWIPALVVSDHYGKDKQGNTTTTPQLQNINFINITIDFAEQIGCLMGLSDAPLRGISFQNVTIKSNNIGWACKYCDNCQDVCEGGWSTECSF